MRTPDMPRATQRLRLLVAGIVSVVLLVPLAAFGAGTSGQSPSAAQYKITICHHTHSKKHPMVTIRISNKAWPAHQKHGDTMGTCPAQSKPKHGQNADKSKGKSGSNGNSGTNPSSSRAQSPSHADDHANDHAKSHGK